MHTLWSLWKATSSFRFLNFHSASKHEDVTIVCWNDFDFCFFFFILFPLGLVFVSIILLGCLWTAHSAASPKPMERRRGEKGENINLICYCIAYSKPIHGHWTFSEWNNLKPLRRSYFYIQVGSKNSKKTKCGRIKKNVEVKNSNFSIN